MEYWRAHAVFCSCEHVYIYYESKGDIGVLEFYLANFDKLDVL